ncbi:MAG: imidazoleglycerol-phosphate dehydratase HisB [Chitinispirillales bacterium]|jgi:imidazoleglycerol-phosphate dehydratase|nr:imidazoleglycerol-phosphate dehydratase HisB [Chitinispirillales bacterium]
MARTAVFERKTNETDVKISLNIDGVGNSIAASGNGFFDHMISLFAKHGLFDLDLKCLGDIEVDFHHSAEDIGITLGAALKEALGDKKGISRYGCAYVPMDETLVRAVIDVSGRSNLIYGEDLRDRVVNSFEVDLVYDFLKGFCDSLGAALHIDIIRSRNSHHAIEAIFKALGRCLKEAATIDERAKNSILSTKGVL